VNRRRSLPQPPPPPPASPATAAELEDIRVVERADGFWVQPVSGGPERGPYASLVEALEDEPPPDEEFEPEDTLAEVEAQVGVSDWIDPDTSALAEDSVPHIEEH
jgi:hypothetical protein